MRNGLKRLRPLLAGPALPCLFGGCTGMVAGGMVLEHAVSYPMRSPEFVLREPGGNHYLLAQWDVRLNANPLLRVRYYDRGTGMLSMPGASRPMAQWGVYKVRASKWEPVVRSDTW